MGSSAGRTLSTFVVGLPLAAAADQDVRGVAPEEQAKYSGSEFRCFTAESSSSQAGAPLPHSAINDNFCDCADGSDEPGTSACAGQQNILFYCPNDQSVPAYIYASRVNDGICDCCDGSDEWQAASSCTNSCREEGRELARERAKKEADLQSGVKQRRALIDKGKKDILQAGVQLQELQAQLPLLEKSEQDAKQNLQAAKAKAREQEKRAAEDGEQAVIEDPEQAATSTTTTQSPSAPAAADAPSSGASEEPPEATAGPSASPPVSEYAKWMEGGHPAAGEDKAAEEKPKVVSEYTKWMEGAAEVLEEPTTTTTTAAPDPGFVDDFDDDDTADQDEPPAKGNWAQKAWAKVRRAASDAWSSAFGWWFKTPEQRELYLATRALSDARAAVREGRGRLETLRAQSTAEVDENGLAFADLTDQCIEKKIEEYKYKVCFFKDAKQDNINVGKFKEWESWNVVLFDKGAYCPGGPHRSFRARFQCGPKLELVDISEPSRCTYEGAMTHPGACTEGLLEALQKPGPRRPTDEL